MRKFIAMVMLAMSMFTPGNIHADGVTAIAGNVTVSAGPEIQQPKWINGNWLAINGYGVPGTQGGLDSVAVAAQYDAYKAAKKANNLVGKVSNGMWSSVQAWAFFNAGMAKLQEAEAAGGPKEDTASRPHYLKAKTYFLTGLSLLKDAGDLGEGENEAQSKAFDGERAQRKDAKKKLTKNLLYVERCLGEKPWPAAGSED